MMTPCLKARLSIRRNGASRSRSNIHYVGEWEGKNSLILEFNAEIDGITIDGIDMITWDDDGLITNFKVMVRPLKAVSMLHQKMGEMLQKAQSV